MHIVYQGDRVVEINRGYADMLENNSPPNAHLVITMQSLDMHELTSNPAEAIQKSHDSPVIVTENDRPEAILIHLNQSDLGRNDGLGLALAVALYRDGAISLARAARLASVSISEMTTHLSRLGIPITGSDPADSRSDIETLEQWLASS